MKNKKAKALSTHLTYIDLATIMANYRNPRFWSKEWTIFESGVFKILWRLRRIDLDNNTIESVVWMAPATYKRGKLAHHWGGYRGNFVFCRDIPIDNPDYTQETLNRSILGATLNLITSVEQSFIHDFAEYKEASSLKQEQDWAAQEQAEQIVDAFNKERGLTESTGDALKEAFVSNFLDEQYASGNLRDYPSEVMKNYAYKVLGFLRLLVCSWFNDKQGFTRYKEAIGDGSKKYVWFEMRKQARLIQTDEWRENMREEAQKLMEER